MLRITHWLVAVALWVLPGGAFATSPEFVDITVAPGDTLSRLAREHGVDVQTLQRENGIDDPRRLRVGQRLRVRKGDAESNERAEANTAEATTPKATTPKGNTPKGNTVPRAGGLAAFRAQLQQPRVGDAVRPARLMPRRSAGAIRTPRLGPTAGR